MCSCSSVIKHFVCLGPIGPLSGFVYETARAAVASGIVTLSLLQSPMSMSNSFWLSLQNFSIKSLTKIRSNTCCGVASNTSSSTTLARCACSLSQSHVVVGWSSLPSAPSLMLLSESSELSSSPATVVAGFALIGSFFLIFFRAFDRCLRSFSRLVIPSDFPFAFGVEFDSFLPIAIPSFVCSGVSDVLGASVLSLGFGDVTEGAAFEGVAVSAVSPGAAASADFLSSSSSSDRSFSSDASDIDAATSCAVSLGEDIRQTLTSILYVRSRDTSELKR